MFALGSCRQARLISYPFLALSFSSNAIACSRFLFMAASPSSAFCTAASPSPSPPPKRVGTHNGSFHCDEALGCFMIRLTDKFKGAEIVRTRDSQKGQRLEIGMDLGAYYLEMLGAVLDTLDAVLDVGGMYDPGQERYDHHQKGFNEVFGHGFSTKLSSAGLIYKHYGMEIIAKELQLDEGHQDVQRLFLAVYKSFVEAVDAVDNGINQYESDQPPRYVNNTGLSSRISRLNLDWMDPDQSPERENEAFHHAMLLAGGEFLEVMVNGDSHFQNVRYHSKSWLPARSIVMESLAARRDVDPSGEIMTLHKFCPWKLHLFELEEEMKIEPSIKYVLYQDGRNKSWRVQAVAVSPDNFESRKPLPSTWRGLRDDELSNLAGIPGCIFIHISGFIGGNQTYEGALAMAKAALRQ
ncbi:hypothetical protein ACLOJK_006242 [Asimina triloba]